MTGEAQAIKKKSHKRGACPQKIPADRHARMFGWLQQNRPFCPIAAEAGYNFKIEDLHHAGMPNTKTNRSQFPLLVHSLLNCCGVSHAWHMQQGRWGQRKGFLWAERYEAFLKRPEHKKILLFVTGQADHWLM